jgi:hypothetical protein
MTNPLEKAKARLAEIRAEAAEIERFIAMFARFSIDANAIVQPLSGANSEEKLVKADLPVDKSRGTRPTPNELALLMQRVIREVGRPMTRGELVAALEARDVEIPGQDKQRYVGTIAWRNKSMFINVEGRGYWVRSQLTDIPTVPPRTTYSDPPEEQSDDLPDHEAEQPKGNVFD